MVNLIAAKDEAQKIIGKQEVAKEDLFSYLMYPKVFEEYSRNKEMYGPVSCLPTEVFSMVWNQDKKLVLRSTQGNGGN